jgi:hypothetical protein
MTGINCSTWSSNCVCNHCYNSQKLRSLRMQVAQLSTEPHHPNASADAIPRPSSGTASKTASSCSCATRQAHPLRPPRSHAAPLFSLRARHARARGLRARVESARFAACSNVQHRAASCNILHHLATSCNILQHLASCSIVQEQADSARRPRCGSRTPRPRARMMRPPLA